MKKKRFLLLILSITICIILFNFSFAYFLAHINGAETSTTIEADSGIMQMQYDGGDEITVTSFSPSATAFATKNFTITGNNNTNEKMDYNINLVMETNTFSFGSLKYKLTSTNTGSNGEVASSITTMKDIGSGAREIFLGNGFFVGPTSGEKIHSYTLELFFPVTGGDQSFDQSKSFNAHIEILEGIGASNEYLTDAIFDDYGEASSITSAPAGTFDNINGSTDNLMYKMEDDYGMSYYLRGAKDYVNNNIIFGGFQWKIVRINGDGSIRLIYNGTCPDNSCTINSTGTTTQIGTSAFNTNYDDNKYIGYMYGGTAGVASTSRTQATTNETNSTMKTYLDNWYSNNILNTEYEQYISDTLFCNDRQLESEVGGAATGTGFGTSETYYASYYRLYTTKNPDLKCGLKNDRYTVSDTTIGNGALTYPVGLITADETALAGLKQGIANSTNYLYTNQVWWSFSPYCMISSGDACVWRVNSSGGLSNSGVNNVFGVRPGVNLKSNTKIVGTGTPSSPYIVQEETSLGNKILAQYGGKDNITEAPAETFASVSGTTDNLMYKMKDDYGDSYYFRGAKDYVPNNLIFANHQWKIVRINGDGSVRLIYNGTCPDNSCTINSTGTTTQIGTSAFNTNNNDAKYVGYMYGGAAGVASTSRTQATTNETSSTIKTYLDTWYSNNILNTEYEEYISDTLFCNDRQLQSEVGGAVTGTGFGTSATHYAAYYRLYTTKNPNLKCGLKNDRFTVSDTIIGNGALTYPVGLITADEIALAGLKQGIANSTNHLYTNQVWWSFSSYLYSSGDARVWGVVSSGSLGNYYVSSVLGVRPGVSIHSETQVTGTGTSNDPYIVVVP
ncbi:MAG: hypothetical protein PHS24_03710 [Bacilli bacterium]|nr:hypothetical protein [Bacilli bacterium]